MEEAPPGPLPAGLRVAWARWPAVSAAPARAGTTGGAWAEEMLRGAGVRAELPRQAGGGAYATGRGARLLGVAPQAVQQRRTRGRPLSVPPANGEWGYPACQIRA